MALTMQAPELKCMEPEHYKKFFRITSWGSSSRHDKNSQNKIGKREKGLKSKAILAICYAPSMLWNPSQFAVFATIRRTIITRWKCLPGVAAEFSDDSDDEDISCSYPPFKVPKITGIGLRAVFELISQARFTDSHFCDHALRALLDVLQGHPPEELALEPAELLAKLHAMLVEVSAGSAPGGKSDMPTNLTAVSSSCLISLSVARGEVELILKTVASLIMSPPSLSEQYIQIPLNLTTLQRSVQSVILGSPSQNKWLHYGVPNQSLVTSFPVDLPAQLTLGSELVVRSLVSDGCYLYVFTSRGLLKIGSGYGSSIKQHVYMYKPDFFASDRHGWLGYCKNKLYARIGRKKHEVYEIDKKTLESKYVVRLEPGNTSPVEPKSSVFTDGNQLGIIMLLNYDNLTIRFYDMDKVAEKPEGVHSVTPCRDMTVPLLRKRTLVLGRAPFDDGLNRRAVDLDSPVAIQLDDNDEDPLIGISAGQDFGLLTTQSGKVYYTGKGASLGYKANTPHPGRWTLIKESMFTRNDASDVKKVKVIQVAVGHEGVHAVLVLDNGTALFTGISRRGEDGDTCKHRRAPKPMKPKKIFKAEGHFIIHAACNYGSTALLTRQGILFMFGKDTLHCDATGLVTGLQQEKVIQVALGKAHAVALTNFGLVYTFGINNKGQCGREFGYTKEKPYTPRPCRSEIRVCSNTHTWRTDYCRVCVMCRECTGFVTCQCVNLPNRVPGEKCGCGEGDAGCSVCGICRRCAEAAVAASKPSQIKVQVTDLDDPDGDSSTKSEREAKYVQYEAHLASETEREASLKVSCLPPARVPIPGGHRICAIASGLHHTVLLTDHGEVLTFGSNQNGQLGAGDTTVYHKVVRVRVPKCTAIAAGSNHTVVLTREGELYTFGSFQKGALGRPRMDEPDRTDRSPIWYAVPGRVPRIGPRHACKAVWVSACGDQTFVQVSQAVINTDTLFSSTITANSNCIVILPNRPEHTFKCVTINRADGACNAWTGAEQVDFVNTLACIDPLYDVIWCYQPQMRVMKCFNILAFDSHKLQRCCVNDNISVDIDFEYPSFGSCKKLEDFKNLETLSVACNNQERAIDNAALSNMSILNQDLAIPSAPGCSVTRLHAALHLLGCLDSLTYAYDNNLNQTECKRDYGSSSSGPKNEFLTVNRFENHGGGWGYSGHSVEAIRFMCDTDINLGGYGLFGGRGDYTAKIKLIDIGSDGGDQEGDGVVIAETDEIVYECPPRDRFPVLFETPILIVANRWYVALACINGPSSDCGSSGQAVVITDEVGFHFKTSKKSNNGTDINAGQIPCLLYNLMAHDHLFPIRSVDPGDPVIILTRNISRKVTVYCFKSLITLLKWSWTTFKGIMLDTNGQIPINYQKLTVMKHQKRLVYVIRACLRLVKSYINEVYPQNKKTKPREYVGYFEVIADVRNFIQVMIADPTPNCTMLPRKAGKMKTYRTCYVQFALELANSIIKEAHETITACFHAFFPTPTLKWSHLCYLLSYLKDGSVPNSKIRELAATCAALCASRSLCDVLQYIVPVTQNYLLENEKKRPDSKVIKDLPSSKSATVPRSSHAQKPPPVPPRANSKESHKTVEPDPLPIYSEWHLLDVIPKLLDIVMIPIKEQMMTRQCGQPHDHGEIKQQELLSEFTCKFTARIIAELSYSATDVMEDVETNTVKHLVTPSRFMRISQSRCWNTGNGSPDAICFSVDHPGVMLVGACVYGGIGSYEYSLELLHDARQLRNAPEDSAASHCWVGLEQVHGSFTAIDCQHDVFQIKFDRPVPMREDLRYAIRLCNHGGRTANGDCGLPSVKGPDDTLFKFSSCSLSFNGTTLARGQIPSLIYYSTSKSSTGYEASDSYISALRNTTLKVAASIIERSAELFSTLRNELTAEDLRRNASVLQQSPAINTLIPYTLANLEGLDDAKSVTKMLEMIHKLLPHVAAMNLLVPNTEESNNVSPNYYAWIESDHPYKLATVTNMRVLFPQSVSWMVLEMDSRSITAQPEDNLTVYAVAGTPKQKCHCVHDSRLAEPTYRRVYKKLIQLTEAGEAEEISNDTDEDSLCAHYNCSYISITPRMANQQTEWPQSALLVPGNEAIFSLETASDYLNEYNKTNNDDNRYGFRCLCVGYEDAPLTSQRQGLVALEMELIYAGGACASNLLAPDLEISPLSFSTMVEVQMQTMMTGSPTGSESEAAPDAIETLLLSRGMELSSPPTVHHVLNGHPLIRCVSTERQFLADFVAGAESTAGGRLARWLAPTPHVDPTRCEIKAPTSPVRPGSRVSIPIIVRDQYGDVVTSPVLKVEVVVHRLEERQRMAEVPYHPTLKDSICFHVITMMKAYQDMSFEELRLASGAWGKSRKGGGTFVPAERLLVQSQADGTYHASWTARTAGIYSFRCTFDDQPAPQELKIVVVDSTKEGEPEKTVEPEPVATSNTATKQCRFVGKHSAGLRVRSSPSLQAEELGSLPSGSNICFVEEQKNKDGTWVRLSKESIRDYLDSSVSVAWCVQHHRQLDRVLLVPIEPNSPTQMDNIASVWGGHSESRSDTQSMQEDEDSSNEERGKKGSAKNDDDAIESDGSSSSFNNDKEPSKRLRSVRKVTPPLTPKRSQRKNNGNSDDWWSPVKQQRLKDHLRDVTIIQVEADIEPVPASKRGGHLAQAGTQTSPESTGEELLSAVHLHISNKEDSKSTCERQLSPPLGIRRLIPPILPARIVPVAPPSRKKKALSPGQAECLRAVFASLLWHEGIVHDAIACAAFLKFHPQLPKQGTPVVTRTPHDVTPHTQRHSVEVTNAGQYLHINPSTLETLTRSGAEASASRMRKADIDLHLAIKEEDGQAHSDTGSSLVVNVLPPALRAIVALWDSLYESDQLAMCTDKFRNDDSPEDNENDACNGKNTPTGSKYTTLPVRCELCGNIDVTPPLAAHMRNNHPGCRAMAAYGYDRAGLYRRTDMLPTPAPSNTHNCGQLAQAYQLWYIYCQSCRDKAIKEATEEQFAKLNDIGFERAETQPEIDHNLIKENALFLLDLAPLTNSEQIVSPIWQEAPGRSPPTPPGSLWQPAPPFQVLPALGAAPKAADKVTDAARYHSLGRPPPPSAVQNDDFSGESQGGSQIPRVHRSISMGQASGRDLAQAARPLQVNSATQDPPDTLSGAGSSLLSMPSAALQRIVGCEIWDGEGCSVSAFEPAQVDADTLIKSPVIAFVLARRDLHSFRQKLDANVRINTVRQYAFEAMNWLLRSTTQPTSVHDVMWWFCNALEKYSRIVPPPITFDDAKENIACEFSRSMIPTASACAICPGGRSARGARTAFHAFLGSISSLAPSLPPASASILQAVRCWSLHYSPYDRAFLHRSQVFSVVSKILSHSEEGTYDDGVLTALQESFHSFLNKDNFGWSCPDVTAWCDITVSSREGMAGALSDGSTETFWESGDEDRNKAKWIEVLYPGGAPDDRPHMVCIHVDNTRDTSHKTILMSFLYSSGSSEMFHMEDVDIDPKVATWVSYTLPRITSSVVRVRVELRGPEPSVRVRQVRLLASPIPHPAPALSPAKVLHSLCEVDTLKVFRLLTSQVFGKLLEWNRSGRDFNGDSSSGDDAVTIDDTDLREHAVGILFAGHKLTSLQRQVMSHIVMAIGCEAGRVRDDWETALLCVDQDRGTNDSDTGRDNSEEQPPRQQHQQDNYCFEMLSLLLALSGSSVGRLHLAQRTELLGDLLSLLHTGSERVQRQVISLLRRMIMEIPPQKMLVAINYGTDLNERISLLDHLLCYLGKAITVQVKVKSTTGMTSSSAMMGTSIASSAPGNWFMRGETTKKHAQLVAKLISDMAEDRISLHWSSETTASLTNYATQVAQISESDRRPSRCTALPTLWMSLAALCVCEQTYIDQMNGLDDIDARARESDSRPFCSNHDDGETLAAIECRNCGHLCAECDRFLHLNRSMRSHHRKICKEEESAIRIDIHEGCGRAKLFWLLLLVDRRTLKGLAEFRCIDTGVAEAEAAVSNGPPPLAGACRFCGTKGNSGLLAIGNVCADQQCQEYGEEACSRVLPCNHLCGGVRGERACLPCLFGCSPRPDAAPLRQDADDMCMICFTDPLQAAPAIQLKCGHVFHLHCCKKVLANKWNGPRISFSFSQCPICKDDIHHWTLEEHLMPMRRLREEVRRKALMRLEYEGLSVPGQRGKGKIPLDPAVFAMERYAYYVCFKCDKAYFGGLARCEAEFSGCWEPSELVCGACSDVNGARICPKHGADFLEYKCRYCCSVAVFFCFGTSHFCNACHDDFQRVTNIPKLQLPQCPAGPKCEQLPGTSEECPLHVQHPATGEEFALGCGICRHAHSF